MMCDRCRNNEASVHLTEIIRGMHSEAHLCEKCAREIGFNTKISDLTSIIEETGKMMIIYFCRVRDAVLARTNFLKIIFSDVHHVIRFSKNKSTHFLDHADIPGAYH
jgi:hypothetical protein